MLEYQFRPIEHWPRDPANRYQRSIFRAPWSKTLDLLEAELKHLRAKSIVIQAAVDLDEIRNDGMLRANARPKRPGVILSFDSKHGPLSYPCDRFDDWQDNVRAIALALQALRAVDRYGVTRRAEQYQGWQRLPPPNGSSVARNPFRDNVHVLSWLWDVTGQKPNDHPDVASLLRQAEFRTHPDHGGTAEAFKLCQQARAKLMEPI